MKIEPPEKPAYYFLRAYGPFLWFFSFFVLLQFMGSIPSKIVLMISYCAIYYLATRRFNPKEISEYHEYLINKEKETIKPPISDDAVRENIARYREEQRIKKENAKWWQFWYW
ncbi:hypothetical protein [Aurantivibrio infirmus]